jgi:tetratricopeptide (TPR) repeat protein
LAVSAGLSADADSDRRFDLVLLEQDNLRAGIDWSVAAGRIELGLRLAVALENFWVTVDPFEGMRRFETLLAVSGDVSPVLRARALRCYAGSSFIAGLYDQAQRALEESLEGFRLAGDEQGVAVLLHRLGTNALSLGRSEQARDLLEESLTLFRGIGSKRGEAQAVGSLGYVAQGEGDTRRAIDLFEESLAIVDRGFAWWRVGMLLALAECELEIGRIAKARARAWEALSEARQIADRPSVIFALALLACVSVERGDIVHAGRLWGAIESEAGRRPVGQWEGEREHYAVRLRRGSDKEFDRGVEQGRRLALDAAIDEALDSH